MHLQCEAANQAQRFPVQKLRLFVLPCLWALRGKAAPPCSQPCPSLRRIRKNMAQQDCCPKCYLHMPARRAQQTRKDWVRTDRDSFQALLLVIMIARLGPGCADLRAEVSVCPALRMLLLLCKCSAGWLVREVTMHVSAQVCSLNGAWNGHPTPACRPGRAAPGRGTVQSLHW